VRTVSQQVPQTVESDQRVAPRPVFLPPADIYEARENIVVLAEMPGVAPDGVDITLERRVLTPSADEAQLGIMPAISGFITNMPMAIMRGCSHSRKTSTGIVSRPR
jgi:hypothetical protein